MALTKADLADEISLKIGLNKREAKELVEEFFKAIIHGLGKGKMVKLSGFGNFICRDKRSRPGRNPKTGEPVEITARRVVTFHAGQKLKSKVENYEGEINNETTDDKSEQW